MERTLPLILCFSFIYVLLRIERRQANQVSGASWIPTLWMLHCASKPIARWLEPYGLISITGDELETGSAVDRNFLLLLMIFGFVIIARRNLNWALAFRQNRWLVFLMAYLLVSCLWSSVPFSSLKQWTRVLGAFIMALVILTESEPSRALESILTRTIYILIPLSVVLVKWVPELGVAFGRWSGERSWEGACLQKNGLGRLCLVSAVILVWQFVRRWKGGDRPASRYQTPLEILIFLMVFYLLIGPGGGAFSATAIGTLVLCWAVLLGLLLSHRGLAANAFGIVAVITMSLAVLLSYISITGLTPSLLTGALGRDSTFTGRTEIWAELRDHAWRQPVLGTGYHGFWGVRHPDTLHLREVNEGHNGYLDVFLSTGFVGLALFLILLASYVAKATSEKTRHFDWSVFKLVFFLMIVVHNFTETSFLRSSTQLWVLLIFLYVVVPARSVSRSGLKKLNRPIQRDKKTEVPGRVTISPTVGHWEQLSRAG